MSSWRCSKCGNSTYSTLKPLIGTCVRGGGHRWLAADNPTIVRWRCGKCGNTVASSKRPLDRTCTRGGKCSWRKN
jgi:ribosomal protein S27AE